MSDGYPWSESGAAIDHVGILTDDFEAIAALFGSRLGLDVGTPEIDHELGLEFLWVRCGEVPLEFIRAVDPDGPAAARLRARGAGVDHIALAVDSVADSLAWCRERGIETADAAPRHGAKGSVIAFLDVAEAGGARVELVEHPDVGEGG
jgi:methylmalonyl-CoA/ethylmalonyl-CoA epimerase